MTLTLSSLLCGSILDFDICIRIYCYWVIFVVCESLMFLNFGSNLLCCLILYLLSKLFLFNLLFISIIDIFLILTSVAFLTSSDKPFLLFCQRTDSGLSAMYVLFPFKIFLIMYFTFYRVSFFLFFIQFSNLLVKIFHRFNSLSFNFKNNTILFARTDNSNWAWNRLSTGTFTDFSKIHCKLILYRFKAELILLWG